MGIGLVQTTGAHQHELGAQQGMRTGGQPEGARGVALGGLCPGSKVAWLILVVLSQLGPAARANLTIAVLLPEHNTTYPWAWPRVGPAIQLAIQAINSQADLLPGHAVKSVFKNSENHHGVCSDVVAPLSAVDLKMAHNPDAFMGPGCVYPAAPVARFTTHWKLPLVTAAAEAFGFSRKDNEFALTTRTGPSHGKLGEFGVCLNQQFNWTRHSMLLYWDDKIDERPYFFAMEGLFVGLGSFNNMTVEAVPFGETNYTSLIRDIKRKARSKSESFGSPPPPSLFATEVLPSLIACLGRGMDSLEAHMLPPVFQDLFWSWPLAHNPFHRSPPQTHILI